jgi:hypothetical protein
VNPRQGVRGERDSAFLAEAGSGLHQPEAPLLKQVVPVTIAPRVAQVRDEAAQVHGHKPEVLPDQLSLVVVQRQ